MKKTVCAACGHEIDASAKLCPYCGADPESGRKVDPTPIIQSHFPPRTKLSSRERMLDFFRTRQSIVLTIVIALVALIALSVHQFITQRNTSEADDVQAMPLTEVADLSNRPDETAQLPIPEMEFSDDAQVRNVRTLLMEPGAVAPAQAAPSPTAAASGASTPPQRPVPQAPGPAPARVGGVARAVVSAPATQPQRAGTPLPQSPQR